MTPFDTNPDNDAGHALDQNDLIAFHLHELSSPQERAVHRVLHTNPALQSESLAIASTLRAFPKHEAALPLDAAALDRHWLALRDSLPVYVAPAIVPRSFFPRWGFPALAASALAATAILLSLHHMARTTPSIVATNQSPSSANTVPLSSSPTSAPDSALSSGPSTPLLAMPYASISHTPFLNVAPQQPRSASASISPTSLPSLPSTSTPTPQPIGSSPSETSAANTSITATQRPQSLPSPTFTPILETRGHVRPHHDHTTDATFAAFADLTSSRSFTSTTGTGTSTVTIPYSQTASPSFGVLASFHQQFRPWLGYRVAFTHSAPTFEYTYSPTATSSAGVIVPENVFELSATYVVQGPRRRRLSTSAEAGAGVLDFHPTNPNAALGVSNSLRSTAVLGVSAELALTQHLSLHAGYRALLYKTPPAYLTTGLNIPPSGNLTFSSEPVVGLTYRFRAPRGE